MRGFEPLTSAVQRQRSPNLSYIPKPVKRRVLQWAFQDSNLRPFPYQRNALTN
jgi:hypothetical protein